MSTARRHATDAEPLAAIPDDVAAYEEPYRGYVRRVTASGSTSAAGDLRGLVTTPAQGFRPTPA